MYKVFGERTNTAQPTPKLAEVYQNLFVNKTAGFVHIPSRPQLFEDSKKWVAQLKSAYEQFVIIGIGGSSMGSRALVDLAAAENIYFLENVDSFDFQNVWRQITKNNALSKTAFIVVSKSGSTIEILWNYSNVEKKLQDAGLNLSERSFFITENNGNPLAKVAAQNKRPLLEVPVDIGGRFSVLTPVGLVVAGLCGLNLDDIRKGAQAAVENREEVLSDCKSFLDSFARGEVISLFWFYNSAYRWFGAWLQQLWAESLGKQTKEDGSPAPAFSTPITAIGACDQHSILQQVAHGTLKNKFVSFYGFKSSENFADLVVNKSFPDVGYMTEHKYGDLIKAQIRSTEEALRQNGVSTQHMQIDDSNLSYTIGFLFMHFQLVVAVLGLHEKINPFDQPGVALGKELALKKLKK
jgi:glucose-6-phosphate isomerase